MLSTFLLVNRKIVRIFVAQNYSPMEEKLEKMTFADLHALDQHLLGRPESDMTKPMLRLIHAVQVEISKRINALIS
jgi:hypothetical protein